MPEALEGLRNTLAGLLGICKDKPRESEDCFGVLGGVSTIAESSPSLLFSNDPAMARKCSLKSGDGARPGTMSVRLRLVGVTMEAC